MRKILIATHGIYAEGIKSAAEFILGPQPDITTICAYTGDIALKDQLEEYFGGCTPEDEVLILTDIYGGSVNQACMEYMKRPGTHLITGINLALLLQIMTLEETACDKATLLKLVEEAKEQISYVNESVKEVVTDDFNI